MGAKRQRFTEREIEFIKDNYEKFGPGFVGAELNRSIYSVSCIARRYGLSAQRYQKWSREDEDFLSKNYGVMEAGDIAKKLSRPNKQSVHHKAFKMGLTKDNMRPRWGKAEIEFILNNYPMMDKNEIAKKLGRSSSAVKSQLSVMGLTGL